MERYKSLCSACNGKPITYECEWKDSAPKCIYCHATLDNRELFPFFRIEKPKRPVVRTKKQKRREKKRIAKERRIKHCQDGGYRERSKSLTAMGFASYGDYLKSPLWMEIRDRIIARDKSLCAACGKTGREVHHRSYSQGVLEGVQDSQLILLCGHCHGLIEFSGDTKCTLTEANSRLDSILHGTPLPNSHKVLFASKRKRKHTR